MYNNCNFFLKEICHTIHYYYYECNILFNILIQLHVLLLQIHQCIKCLYINKKHASFLCNCFDSCFGNQLFAHPELKKNILCKRQFYVVIAENCLFLWLVLCCKVGRQNIRFSLISNAVLAASPVIMTVHKINHAGLCFKKTYKIKLMIKKVIYSPCKVHLFLSDLSLCAKDAY